MWSIARRSLEDREEVTRSRLSLFLQWDNVLHKWSVDRLKFLTRMTVQMKNKCCDCWFTRRSSSLGSWCKRLTIEHRLRLNEYILYVFEQTRRFLTIFRAKICLESHSEMSSTFKSQKHRYEVSRSTRADSSQLIKSDYLWYLLETFNM